MSRLFTRKSIRRKLAPFKDRWSSKLGFLFNRKSLLALTILILLAAFIAGWRIKNRAQSQLDEERARLEKQNIIPFEKKLCPAAASKEIQVWQSFKSTRALARFKDSYFAATDGGLVELGPTGDFARHYSVLDGLPESDLVSLAAFSGKLFIGTRTQALVSFDGERFESYRWLDRSPQAVSALFEDGGRLLIGTMAGGLIEFDGRQFKEIKVGAQHKRLSGIISLAKSGSRLYVGTFADGLWVEEGARWFQFTVAEGLLSNRVIGVASDRENLFVASDYGVTEAPFSNLSSEAAQKSARLFQSVAILPSLSSIVQVGSNILLCKDNGESFGLRLVGGGARLSRLDSLAARGSRDVAGAHLVSLDRDLWFFSNDGIRRAAAEGLNSPDRISSPSFNPVGQKPSDHFLMTNLISALTVDSQGRVWAGGFRNGIDVVTPEGKRLAHLESDDTREINFMVEDQKTKTMLAATSQGVLRFDANLRAVQRWSTAEGLLSNAVMQVAQTQVAGETDDRGEDRSHNFIACATGKGLSIGVPGKLRSLTTVQGLPSNSLYTVLLQGQSIYAGTLSGLAVIEDGRVVRVFKDSNSNLTHNWVTALARVGSRLFIGTYGGGVFELTPSGELVGFGSETGRTVVNPNAMWSDGVRLYIGTLDGALVFELHSQKWTRLQAELPSRTVLSITGDEKFVYFGTTSGIARVARGYWERV